MPPRTKRKQAPPTRAPKSKDDRGEYRSIYVAMLGSPEFQALSPEARACLYPLKLKLGRAGIAEFYLETLPRLTGYPIDTCTKAVQELGATGWIIVSDPVVWLRNGLRFDPSNPLASSKSRMGIVKHLLSLPKSAIINEFLAHYPALMQEWNTLHREAPCDTPSETPSDTPSHTPSGQVSDTGKRDEGREMREEGIRNTENGKQQQQQQPSSLNPGAHTNGVAATAGGLTNEQEDQISQVIIACNTGMAANPKLREPRPILRSHPSRQHVADWLLEGIRYETIIDVVHGKAKDATTPIYSMAYFDRPVREAHENGLSSVYAPPAGSPASTFTKEREKQLHEERASTARNSTLEKATAEREASEPVLRWKADHPDETLELQQAIARDLGAESWEALDTFQRVAALPQLHTKIRERIA